jgi:SCY1-like protein 2
MGSALTKAYDIEKEPSMAGGIHGLWPVYRAKKKQQNMQECSIFMFDKKAIKAPKTQAGMDLLEIVKRDATNLAKFKHPGVLNLVESPIEDKAQIAFVTEPVTTNLAGLTMRGMELIPSEVEVKCMVLELMECVNFLHSGAKHIHLNLAPENLYLTKVGKLKVAGFNFIQPFQTASPVPVALDFALRIGDFAMVPNLRFAAPEVTASPSECSVQSDIFSIGCLIFFLMRLSKGKHPYFLLDQREQTNK